MNELTIGKVAAAAGVGVETIRFYERLGLVQQPRKPVRSGFRIYSDEVVARVRFIRRAQQIGFSLREVEELLSLRTDPDGDCADVRDRATAKLADVDRKIMELGLMREALRELIGACPAQGTRRYCTILEALESKTTKTHIATSPRRSRKQRKRL